MSIGPLKPRRAKRATAISKNIVLQQGEILFEVPSTGQGTGIGKIKMGDGTTGYENLPYFLDTEALQPKIMSEPVSVNGEQETTVEGAVDALAANVDSTYSSLYKLDAKVNRINNSTYLEPSTWVEKSWSGLSGFSGTNVWTDGYNIYYSSGSDQYVLDESTSTWSTKVWTGLSSFNGSDVWADGNNVYYSNGSTQMVLDSATSTWTSKSWSGLTSFNAEYIWIDGATVYYDYNTAHYVLDRSSSTWSAKTWSGYTSISGDHVWTDGINIYYSNSTAQYVLNRTTSTWSSKSWTGLTSFDGNCVWTDGTNTYYSKAGTNYKLDRTTSTWSSKAWTGLTSFDATYIWTNGIKLFYDYNSSDYELSMLDISGLQTKVLSNPITIDGETKDTVESALGGLANEIDGIDEKIVDVIDDVCWETNHFNGSTNSEPSMSVLAQSNSATGIYSYYIRQAIADTTIAKFLISTRNSEGTIIDQATISFDASTDVGKTLSCNLDITSDDFTRLYISFIDTNETTINASMYLNYASGTGVNYKPTVGSYIFSLYLESADVTTAGKFRFTECMLRDARIEDGTYVNKTAFTNGKLTYLPFTESSSKTNIESKLSIDTNFGRIKRFLRALKAVAFSGSIYDLKNILNQWSDKAWTGLTTISGQYIWTDGDNIYYDYSSNHYILDKSTSTWSTNTWSGYTSISGEKIWSDGTNIYYSNNGTQYVLDKSTTTWSTKTWTGLTSFDAQYIWTDGTNIYYSYGNNQYVLDKSTSTWSTKTWTGLTSFHGYNVWTDGYNIYYSGSGSNQYVLDKSTSTWSTKTWSGLTSFNGQYIWTDGTNIYYSNGGTQYILDNDNWIPYEWAGCTIFAYNIWTDGDNIYYSSGSNNQKVLDKSPETPLQLKDLSSPITVAGTSQTTVEGTLNALASTSDSWTPVSTVDANSQVTFTGLSDSKAYALYVNNKVANIVDVTVSGSGSAVSMTYTLSGVTTGDNCKLRVVE